MTGRRLLLAAPLAAALPRPAAAVAPDATGQRWNIVREGRRIGTHTVSFAARDGIRQVRSEVEIVVRLAGFTVFRYRHDYGESWDGNRLVGFRSLSERQGTVVQMAVRPDGAALLAESDGGRFRLPREAAPLSWWDPTLLRRPLFDTTTGAPVEPRPVREAVAGGERWRLPTPPNAEATYDAAGHWIGFTSLGEDGVAARYEPA